MGFITDDDITGVLSRQYGVPSINLKFYEIDPTVIKLIPQDTASRYQVIPLSRVGSVLTIAMTDPTNVFAMDDIKFMTGFNVEPVVASESAIGEAISRFYGGAETNHEELSKMMKDLAMDDQELELAARRSRRWTLATLERAAEEAPIIKLVNLILTDSVKRGASDIHIEPYEIEMRVRFRIDGVSADRDEPAAETEGCDHEPPEDHGEAGHRGKAAAARRPHHDQVQGGRQKEGIGFPCIDGPDAIRRKDRAPLAGQRKPASGHDEAGLRAGVVDQVSKRHICEAVRDGAGHRPDGLRQDEHAVFVSRTAEHADTNIMTAEDPVEFQLAGINQVQMKEQIGLNFAAALRAFLRQDPNIILVGEIRDFETAEIAVKAALTGHLVLSTLHTNDAPSTISRLMNMGIEPFLVATSVNLICAQRLVRRICANCKERNWKCRSRR